MIYFYGVFYDASVIMKWELCGRKQSCLNKVLTPVPEWGRLRKTNESLSG